MLPSEFWDTTLAETVIFVEEQGRGEFVLAWKSALLNSYSFNDPRALPKNPEMLWKEETDAEVSLGAVLLALVGNDASKVPEALLQESPSHGDSGR